MSLGALALGVVQASAVGTVNSPGTSMRSGREWKPTLLGGAIRRVHS